MYGEAKGSAIVCGTFWYFLVLFGSIFVIRDMHGEANGSAVVCTTFLVVLLFLTCNSLWYFLELQ